MLVRLRCCMLIGPKLSIRDNFKLRYFVCLFDAAFGYCSNIGAIGIKMPCLKLFNFRVSESASRSHQHGEECVGQRVRSEQEESRQHATFARERRRYRRRDAELSRHLRATASPSVVLSRERYGQYFHSLH